MMTPEQKKDYNRAYYAARQERFRAESLERHRQRKALGLVDTAAKSEYDRAYRAAHPEKCKRTPEEQKARSEKLKERYNADPVFRRQLLDNGKRRREKNPARMRSLRYLRKYGLTIERFDEMLADQGDKCAICGDGSRPHKLHFPLVDHCHATNKVRGILCQRCNHGIGLFKDDPERLRRAAAYIERSRLDTAQ